MDILLFVIQTQQINRLLGFNSKPTWYEEITDSA
jgi:hypothetical protein